MKTSGFTLLEVLIALIILTTLFIALIHLHSLSIDRLIRAKDLFTAVTRLNLFLSGEQVEGVKVERRTYRIKGVLIQEEIYSTVEGNETVYFNIYKKK